MAGWVDWNAVHAEARRRREARASTDSWWLTTDRSAWRAAYEREARRMAGSPESALVDSMLHGQTMRELYAAYYAGR